MTYTLDPSKRYSLSLWGVGVVAVLHSTGPTLPAYELERDSLYLTVGNCTALEIIPQRDDSDFTVGIDEVA